MNEFVESFSVFKANKFLWVSLLLGIGFILILTSTRHKTLTTDEPNHFQYGQNILNLNSDRFDDSKMPISALNAIPSIIAPLVSNNRINKILGEARLGGRVATIFASLLLAYLIFFWSRKFYGYTAGLISLALYVFDPNIIAHSRLITTDIYAALTITAATYFFYVFCAARNMRNATFSAVFLGISQIAKYTSILLIPIFLIIIVIYDFQKILGHFRRNDLKGFFIYLVNGFIFGFYFLGIILIVINIGFLFNQTLIPFGLYNFKSDFFKYFQNNLSFLESIPIPVPYPYLKGLDWVNWTGGNVGKVYLLESLMPKGEGYPGYFFFAFFFKVPLATQILIIISIILYFKKQNKNMLGKEIFLFVPPVFFMLYFNFLYKAQIGLRMILLIFPFLYVFCGSIIKNWSLSNLFRNWVIILLFVYLSISNISYFPHYLSYFNELVPNRKLSYKVLADSNLDWGQNEYYLEQYISSNQDAIVEPLKPVPGKVIVRANYLVGVEHRIEPSRYQWLRENFEPIDTIAYSYLVYDISRAEFENFLSKQNK